MARNRKRAKERRARRPSPLGTSRPATERDAPDPIEHATPDVELAEVQLAVGRPEASEEPEPEDELEPEEEPEPEEFEAPELESGASAGGHGGDGFNGGGSGGGELALPSPAAPEAKPRAGSRLITFLQGSWNELQRVQWPDRRQTLQATGVVIGFVIVAGVFLGLADYLAAKVVNYVLGNH